MSLSQGKLHPATKVSLNPGLKETVLTVILDVKGQGRLYGISFADPDDLTQNERIVLMIDGVTLFDVSSDWALGPSYINIWLTILNQAMTTWAGVTDQDAACNCGLPFNRLQIAYLRAAAGTAGLTINVLYSITDTGLEVVV